MNLFRGFRLLCLIIFYEISNDVCHYHPAPYFWSLGSKSSLKGLATIFSSMDPYGLWSGGQLGSGKNAWIGHNGALNFAVGLIAHMSSSYSALFAALIFGKRNDFYEEHKVYSLTVIYLGTTMLCFGRFRFNAGSAVAELVAITPGVGFVFIMSDIFMGFITGLICYFSIDFFKKKLKLDDTLDLFASHGVKGPLRGNSYGNFLLPRPLACRVRCSPLSRNENLFGQFKEGNCSGR